MVLERFHAILVKPRNGGEDPQGWEGEIIKVKCKKSDRSNCNNHRGMSLVSGTARIRDSCEAHRILLGERCGSQPNRSTIYMLFVVR